MYIGPWQEYQLSLSVLKHRNKSLSQAKQNSITSEDHVRIQTSSRSSLPRTSRRPKATPLNLELHKIETMKKKYFEEGNVCTNEERITEIEQRKEIAQDHVSKENTLHDETFTELTKKSGQTTQLDIDELLEWTANL